MNLLLVGKPGVGKTTIVEQVVSRLRDDGWRLSGFFILARLPRHGTGPPPLARIRASPFLRLRRARIRC